MKYSKTSGIKRSDARRSFAQSRFSAQNHMVGGRDVQDNDTIAVNAFVVWNYSPLIGNDRISVFFYLSKKFASRKVLNLTRNHKDLSISKLSMCDMSPKMSKSFNCSNAERFCNALVSGLPCIFLSYGLFGSSTRRTRKTGQTMDGFFICAQFSANETKWHKRMRKKIRLTNRAANETRASASAGVFIPRKTSHFITMYLSLRNRIAFNFNRNSQLMLTNRYTVVISTVVNIFELAKCIFGMELWNIPVFEIESYLRKWQKWLF